MRALLAEHDVTSYPKTTGNRGIHVYARLPPRAGLATRCGPPRSRWRASWSGAGPTSITAAWWKEERGERVFIDFNQNAPHKTVFGAWSVRARPGAQVSMPFGWDDIEAVDPDGGRSRPSRPASRPTETRGQAMNDDPQSLEPLLEMHERDRASGLMDAPWPPVYPKQPDEPPRVSRSRAKKT